MSNEELADKLACHELIVAYGSALDRGANQEAAALLSDDSIIAIAGQERAGPEARKYIMNRSPEFVTSHLLTNVFVRLIDGSTAEGHAYALGFRVRGSHDKLPLPFPHSPHALGLWSLRFRKTAMGWRISRCEVTGRLVSAE